MLGFAASCSFGIGLVLMAVGLRALPGGCFRADEASFTRNGPSGCVIRLSWARGTLHGPGRRKKTIRVEMNLA